jgi:hypothetical protein
VGEGSADGGSDSEAIVLRRLLHCDNLEAPSLIRDGSSDVAHERLAEGFRITGY